jgi:RimJ/RimL family protein N-acetyltransferase
MRRGCWVPEFQLETERLILRSWRTEDHEPFWEMSLDPEVMRFLTPLTRADCAGVIAMMNIAQAENGCCFWAMERKSDDRFLGFCGILPPREPTFEFEIGWRLERLAWGQGYACEAAQASLDWVWANLDTLSVVAITVPANKASWGLMIRLGMTYDPAEDFDHPELKEDDPLRRHVLYRIARPQ